MKTRHLFGSAALAAVFAFAPLSYAATPAKPDADMQAVLDKLASLGGKPIETLSPEDARDQPTPADAVAAILKDQGKPAMDDSVETDDTTYTAADGNTQNARIYKPKGVEGPLPVILYIHGGGWVIADIDVYDASPRALAKLANAIVVSVEYRKAPEAKFPAAHDDVLAAYQWIVKDAPSWGGDLKKLAIVGESAGGNMAIDTAIAARDKKWTAPVHVVAVYPVADTGPTDAKVTYAAAKPLNTPMLDWFFKNTLASPDQAKDPRLNLVTADLKGLPPTTIILAEIDPLHDDGTHLADKLKAAGVTTDLKEYEGVTHEFFGMGAVVADAAAAEAYAADKLKAAFSAAPQN